MQGIYKYLIAKTDKKNCYAGLSLKAHHNDTSGIMKKLIDDWMPDSTHIACGMDLDSFKKIAVFAAAVHDIGKATSYFQSLITVHMPEQRNKLQELGFEIHEKYLHRGKTPHAWAGRWILKDQNVPESIADVVGSHHGKPPETGIYESDMLKLYPVNFFGKNKDPDNPVSAWEECWMEIISDALRYSGFSYAGELPEINTRSQILLSGLLIIADWISSNTEYFPLISFDDPEYDAKSISECRIFKGWEKLSFPERWESDIYRVDEQLFFERFGFKPNSIQREIMEIINKCNEPGLYILEAPMGEGKTEAALEAAEILANRHKLNGLFFGLPTQATSNGMFGRLYEWAANVSCETMNAIRLAHGADSYNAEYSKHILKGRAYVDDIDSDDGMEVHPWFQGRKKALLSDFVIGTVDQFLMVALKRKHFMLRHIGLSGKVVIIDEIHAYDAYMDKYLERALEWMAAYGIPVFMMSATLPHQKRKHMIDKYVKSYSKNFKGKKKADIIELSPDWKINSGYPVITWTDGKIIAQKILDTASGTKTVNIKKTESAEELVSILNYALEDGGCAGIIMNTVKKAQEIYQHLKDIMDGYKIILYHAQYTFSDRYVIEEDIIRHLGKNSDEKKRNKVILVGTQVLEQSLDYDVDLMITQLCPIDLLFQRIGRLQRHERMRHAKLKSPVCYILTDGEDIYDQGTKSIYDEYLLKRTYSLIKDEIVIPDDISSKVQKVYGDEKLDCGLSDDDINRHIKILKDKEERAKHYLLDKPSKKNGIINILRNEDTSLEKYADAGVRDANQSIEVLIMKRFGTYKITTAGKGKDFLPVASYDMPDPETGFKIAKQRLRLPAVFSAAYNIDKTIKELEERNINELSAWQQNPWIKGELVLLLDEHGRTSLNGYEVSYDTEAGFNYIRKEDKGHDGKSI